MPRIPHLRVIIETEPLPGAWNMAVDESLLESAISENKATLRWYRWREATVSLGYFQKSADLMEDRVLSLLPAVRRLSGGGAIVHDKELTYSLQLPSSQTLFAKPEQLYDIVHHSLMNNLRETGIPVTFRGETLRRPDEPLLCFERQDSHDLVLNGFKVLGSAQRRRRGAILQHGSLIENCSQTVPHLPGFRDLCATCVPEDLHSILAIPLAETLADSWSFDDLSATELERAKKIMEADGLNIRDR